MRKSTQLVSHWGLRRNTMSYSFDSQFVINKYEFNRDIINQFGHSHFAKDLWPVIYILSDGKIKEAYVGETTDSYARMASHLSSSAKNKLSAVHIIASEKFNKSATLDIESNLIKYISGDGQYKLLNANIGLANHNYYQKKEVYWELFKSIWDNLRAEGITQHSLEYIDNSDIFKYSPYKSLSYDQRQGLLTILKGLLNDDFKNIIVEGGAGTGKTILAVFLFKLMNTNYEDFNYNDFGNDEVDFIETVLELKKKYPKPKMALVVPMSSFRNTLKKAFKNVKGLSANMVIGPSELANEKFEIVVVDESHRLRRRVNLGSYYGPFDKACEKLSFDKSNCSELDWVVKQSEQAIFFYDENQSIKPSDARKEDFDILKANYSTKIEKLKSQFRVRGGQDYVKYIDDLLKVQLQPRDKLFNNKEYEFYLFESIEDLIGEIKKKDSANGLSRLVAGYSWEWASKEDKSLFDIKIDGIELQWNYVANDWVNSVNSVNQVGCIHTTQGYDLNYAGIIFGNEISYDPIKQKIIILKENYFDKNGKHSISDPQELEDFIINIYKTIMLRGIRGTYIYVCDKNLREYFSKYINKFKTDKRTKIFPINTIERTDNSIPIYDLEAAAGDFSELQRVEGMSWVELPSSIRHSEDLFACKVVGESMNRIIPNGSICLFRKYSGGSRNGKIVLVEHTSIQDPDTGSSYTIKEYQSKKLADGDQWNHTSIVLKPLSYDKGYRDIILEEDELSYLKVIGVFERVL